MMKNAIPQSSDRKRLISLSFVVLVATCMMFGTAMAKKKDAPAMDQSTVVGFWHAELHYTDGSLWYQSIQQYHSDGLEMEDASTPPFKPAHVCMGVWKMEGNTVKMYHIIWMYNGSDTPAVNYAVLRETNTLSKDGNSTTGTFDVKIFNIKSGKQVKEIKGTTIAQRIDFQHPFSLFNK